MDLLFEVWAAILFILKSLVGFLDAKQALLHLVLELAQSVLLSSPHLCDLVFAARRADPVDFLVECDLHHGLSALLGQSMRVVFCLRIVSVVLILIISTAGSWLCILQISPIQTLAVLQTLTITLEPLLGPRSLSVARHLRVVEQGVLVPI